MKLVNEPSNVDHVHRFTERVRIGYGMGNKGITVKMCWKCSAYKVKD
jgi:hypothetical protein